MTGIGAAAKTIYARSKQWIAAYLANDDPYMASGNTGAFIVWSNQPFYPLYVAWMVGAGQTWPSLLTWLSTPAFAAVPILGRRHPLAGRCLFVVAGVANTILSIKAFGSAAGLVWFFVPCLVIALMFFRGREWPAILALSILCAVGALASGQLDAPLHVYTSAEYTSLTHLNLYSVTGLTLYLVIAAVRLRLPSSARAEGA